MPITLTGLLKLNSKPDLWTTRLHTGICVQIKTSGSFTFQRLQFALTQKVYRLAQLSSNL